jgi:hypothetical protein
MLACGESRTVSGRWDAGREGGGGTRIPLHTRAFQDAAGCERAHDASLKMVAALAETAADLILDAEFMKAVKQEI